MQAISRSMEVPFRFYVKKLRLEPSSSLPLHPQLSPQTPFQTINSPNTSIPLIPNVLSTINMPPPLNEDPEAGQPRFPRRGYMFFFYLAMSFALLIGMFIVTLLPLIYHDRLTSQLAPVSSS
jgi:hypothetical protein